MKKRLFSLFAAAVVLALSLAGCGSRRFTVEEAQRGVVRVAQLVRMDVYAVENNQITESLGSFDGMLGGTGTAFGVGKAGEPTDIFVTNRHVVSDSAGVLQTDAAGNVTVIYQTTVTAMYILLDDYSYNSSTGLDTSRAVPCSVIYKAADVGPDLAVLQAAEPVEGRIALPLLDPADSSVRPGDTIYALGFPGSADALTLDPEKQVDKLLASIESMTVTKGSITLLSHDVESDTDVLQHDVQTNAGNSGSPLITEDGAVVAVHYMSYTTGGQLETVSKMSVQAGELMRVLDSKNIAYDVYKAGPNPLLFVLIAAAVVVVVVVVILLLSRKKRAGQPAGMAYGPAVPAGGGMEEWRLQCTSGAFAGRRFAINGQLRIGRDPNRNDLVYPGATQGISGAHCVLRLQGGTLWLEDLGSSYGTFLSTGQKLAQGQPVQLRKGDCFYLASQREMFQITGKGGV